MKSRIDWIDISRGYGILLVMLGHLWHSNLIYSFHIPAFFFLSGFTHSTPKPNSSIGNLLIRRIKSILVPYFSLGAVMLIFTWTWMFLSKSHSFSLNDYTTIIADFLLQKRMWTLWFLSCLFILNILFHAILVYTGNRKTRIISLTFILPILILLYYKSGGPPMVWNVDASIMALPFYSAGYLICQHKITEKIFRQSGLTQFFIFIVFTFSNIIFLALNIHITGECLEMYSSKYAFLPFTYISAISGTLALIIFSKHSNNKVIRYIGINSMVFFAWHQTIAMPLLDLAYKKMGVFHIKYSSHFAKSERNIITLFGMLAMLAIANEIIKKFNWSIFTGLDRAKK